MAGLIEILVTWLPILLLIGVFALFAARSQKMYTGRSGKTHGEMLEDYVQEMRRQNDLLEKIVQDQEARLQRLETTRRSSSGGSGGGGSR